MKKTSATFLLFLGKKLNNENFVSLRSGLDTFFSKYKKPQSTSFVSLVHMSELHSLWNKKPAEKCTTLYMWEHKGNKWVVLRELLSTLHAISQKNHENSINRIKPLKSFCTRKNLLREEGGKRKTWKKRRRISKQFNEFIAKKYAQMLGLLLPCVHIFAVWFARTAATPPKNW